MDWDTYFMSHAYLCAMKSKDPSTQVGACIVGPDKEVRSSGYNGPPRGFGDKDASIWNRPAKGYIVAHAEENAISQCARIGVSAKGCTLYATLHPCSTCARMIVTSGISEVVLHVSAPAATVGVWEDDFTNSRRILTECGVTLRWWDGVPVIREVRAAGKIHRFACD